VIIWTWRWVGFTGASDFIVTLLVLNHKMRLQPYITLIPSRQSFKSCSFNNVPLHVSTFQQSSSGRIPLRNLYIAECVQIFVLLWYFMKHITSVMILVCFDTLGRLFQKADKAWSPPRLLKKWRSRKIFFMTKSYRLLWPIICFILLPQNVQDTNFWHNITVHFSWTPTLIPQTVQPQKLFLKCTSF
jgi:hypothetical protein